MQLQTKKLLIGVCKNCSRKFPYLNRGRPKLHCCDECRLTWRRASGSGLHDWGNIQTACRDCNTRKGATVRGQFRLF